MGREEDAAARVRRRLREWVQEHGHGSRKRLAEAVTGLYGVSLSASWATDVLRRDEDKRKATDVQLAYLDALAELLNMPPGELVARDGDHYLEVTPSERRLIMYFRSMPDVIRGHAVAYLDFLFSAHQERAQDEIAAAKKRNVAASRLARNRIDRNTRRRKGA